jgi:hypothetical protein
MSSDPGVCRGLLRRLGGRVVDALSNSILSPDYFCEELAPTCVESGFVQEGHTPYIERVLSDKPNTLKSNDYLNKLYKDIKGKTDRARVRAVHFSDPHVDYQYAEGSDNKCTGYLCCRVENGFPSEDERKAERWGGYRCDLP